MKKVLLVAAVVALGGTIGAAPVPFTYRFTAPQKVTEKAKGAVSDGDPATIAYWKGPRAVVECEFTSTTPLKEATVTLRKSTNWYLMKEVEVALDDGSGEFGDPQTVRVDIAPYGGKAPVIDSSCTNLVCRVPLSGRAVRARVLVKTAAWGAIADIAFDDGQVEAPRREGAVAPGQGAAKDGKKTVSDTASTERRTPKKPVLPDNLTKVENKYFKVLFTPLGGRALSIRAKFLDDVELTDACEKGGTFSEFDWSRRGNFFFYKNKPFTLKPFAADGVCGLDARGNAQGGGTDFLTIDKRYTLMDDATAMKIDYVFGSLPDAMSAQDYGLLIHSTLGVSGRLCSYYFPSDEGIVEIERDKRPQERWIHHPARGWMAAVDDLGRGVALTMPFKEVKSFYSWLAQEDVPTLEWRMTQVSIEDGGTYVVPCEMIAFRGLKKVSGAGGGLVGELRGGKARVYNSRAGKVTAKAGGQTVELDFARPGEVREFVTEATTVVLEKDGQEACRLDAPPKSGAWSLAPLEASRASSVKSFDLTGYTNLPHQACAPFAKPLAVPRRPRIIALTGVGNNVELGFFADRFDCELLTTTITLDYYRSNRIPKQRQIQNPQHDNGDYFGSLTTADVEENLMKTLKKDADAMLVGGLPWEIFPKAAQKLILEKVKKGCGLVWIGQDRAAPEIFRQGGSFREVRETPAAVGEAFADVPFALLGRETAYAFEPGGATVHAVAGSAPYLTENVLGEGRVFHLAYKAIFGELNNESGITPNLRDYYDDRVAPVEYYYSLIAKVLAKAAKLPLAARFEDVAVAGDGARLGIRSEVAGKAMLAWKVRNRHGETLGEGDESVALMKGKNRVSVSLASLGPYAGTLAFEAVLRNGEGGVMAWGAWAFEKAPKACLSAFRLNRSAEKGNAYREGERVAFWSQVKGVADGLRIRFAMTDCFGRLLDEKTEPAAQKVEGGFVLANELPTRTYEISATLLDGAYAIDRLRLEVRARPEPAKWPWDDFRFGIWTGERTREYLWPEFAELFRKMHLTVNIANQRRVAIDFAMRYGFDPTLLANAGLEKCNEPADYVSTGDKLKLVRPTCLSDPAFYARQKRGLSAIAESIANLGLRYVWFGDEQSLTGYGGKPIDFCFSEHCLREFRRFLEKRYGTLARLNAAWETDFANWDAVVPFTRQEVWAEGGERHVAGWADHLEFMDSRVAHSLDYARKVLQSGDDHVHTSISGTQPPTAYGGMDWWKQIGALDGALSYDICGQLELHRSFRPDGEFMPWNWGYSKRGGDAVASLWRTLFVGCKGIIGFHDLSIYNPDWTWSAGYRDVKPGMDRIDIGVGKHLISNLKMSRPVAILYSQASIRAAFYENRADEHSKLRDKYIRLLNHLGYGFDFVSYEQLENGTFEGRGYKVLVLADASAMSDGEVAAVKRFVLKGGAVIAEGVPARREGNCRRRGASPLKEFVRTEKIDVGYLKALEYPKEPRNAVLIAAEQDRLERAFERAGVNPPRIALADATDGRRFRLANVYPREGRGGALFWGVISEEKSARLMNVTFPKHGWVYDLASGKCLGEGTTFKLPIAKGRPNAFELVEAKPRLTAVGLSEDGTLTVGFAGGVDTVVNVRVVDPEGRDVECYAKKLVVKGGGTRWKIPFARNDAKGAWKVVVTDVLTAEQREVRQTLRLQAGQ